MPLRLFDLAPDLSASLRTFGPGCIVCAFDGHAVIVASLGTSRLVALDPTPQFPPQLIIVERRPQGHRVSPRSVRDWSYQTEK